MKASLEVPFNECAVKLYLTLQDIDKLKSLRHSMITRICDNDYLDSNTAYCLITAILNVLETENENNK